MSSSAIHIAEEYTKFAPSLRSYLYRLVCDRNVAEDLAQDTFVRAMEKADSFRQESSYKTWLFRIGTNVALDWLRSFRRWEETAQDKVKELAEGNEYYPQTYLDVARTSDYGQYEIQEHIDFCFTCTSKTLAVEQQICLLLKELYDFSMKDLSLMLDTPQGTIKDWLFHARKSMQDIFERRCALINKNGVCHQCSQLNGFFNPKQQSQEQKLFSTLDADEKERLLEARISLIKCIDPLRSSGSDLHDTIMQTLRVAIGERNSIV